MYPEEPELAPEDPSRKFSLPLAQRIHTLTARALKRTHWLYEPDSFIPAAQLVEDDSQATQKMTGTGGVAYSSSVSTDAATPEPQLYYIHTDHLGTPQELTNRDGHLQWEGRYRAWGELTKAHNHDGYAASIEMPLRFQGQYCDAETGLHYNHFRYYDPQVGRFTTQDPISLAGGINLYQYAPNPVVWIDPTGLTSKQLATAMVNAGEPCPKNSAAHHIPDGTTEQFEYDGEGNLTRYVNPKGDETRYAYDGKGLPTERIDAAGFRLAYQYDTLRRLSYLTNQNNEQWRFEYDGVGRLKQEVGFDGRTRKYQYDEGGMLLTYSEGDQATLYERDSTGLLMRKVTERTGYSLVETHYAHDRLGRLTSVQNSRSAVRLHYDTQDNLIAEEQTADLPDGHYYRSVYRHTYDVLGNRQTTTLPNGQEVAWLRYGSGHVHAMSLDRQPLFDFERDALHRETARHYGPQQQTRQYDVMGRLTRQQRLLGEEAKQQRLYHYTQTSELYGIDDTLKGETRYRYDPIGRLKAASTPLGDETFAFDPAGNLIDPELLQNAEQHRDRQPINTRWDGVREEVTFDYCNLPKVMGNLLERYAGTHYQYDERGNRRRQTEPSGRTTEYVYDADDQLKEVKRYRRAPAAGDTTPPDMHAQYGYDGFGRRLWKLVKEGKATPKLTVFSWDANLLTSEEVFEGKFHFGDLFMYPEEPELVPENPSRKFSLPLAQRIHTLTARALKRTHWLYEPDSFIPAAQLVEDHTQATQRMTGTGSIAYSSTMSADVATPEPQLYYIHTDHLGTPQELTDCNGNLQWVGRYRAWGELAKAHNHDGYTASVEMPLRFQGQYCDAETGLHYNHFRYYDPQVGRFTTQDPISLAGGINLYQYAPNPVGWVDPLGLARGKNRKGNKPSDSGNTTCPTGEDRYKRQPLSRKEAEEKAVHMGYRRTNQLSSGKNPILENRNAPKNLRFITYDRTAHTGGTWKGASKISDLKSSGNVLRSGTYDSEFNRIAD